MERGASVLPNFTQQGLWWSSISSGVLGMIGPNRALDRMAPDYRTVPDYRHLQLVCERQAVVASNEEARRAFKNLAEEYREMADFLEQKLQEQQKH
jgi:hypothetical protein